MCKNLSEFSTLKFEPTNQTNIVQDFTFLLQPDCVTQAGVLRIGGIDCGGHNRLVRSTDGTIDWSTNRLVETALILVESELGSSGIFTCVRS